MHPFETAHYTMSIKLGSMGTSREQGALTCLPCSHWIWQLSACCAQQIGEKNTGRIA